MWGKTYLKPWSVAGKPQGNKRKAAVSGFATLLMACFCLSVPLMAQDCVQDLERATRFYDEGQLATVEGLILPCLRNGYSNKADLVRAYRLLILTYLYRDQTALADAGMMELLRNEQEYVPGTSEPAEYLDLYNAFRTTPVATIGVMGGGTYSYVSPINFEGVSNTRQGPGTYRPQLGFQAGINANLAFGRYLEISTGAFLKRLSFAFNREMFGYTKLDFEEFQNWAEIPLGVKIMAGGRRFKPYLTGGGSAAFLLNSTAAAFRGFTDPSIAEREVQVLPQDMSGQRVRLAYGFFGGAGIKYKIPKGYLNLQATYTMWPENRVDGSKRFSNQELVYRYGYVDNDFSLSHLSVSVGVLYCIYKPKKTKRLSGKKTNAVDLDNN